MTLIYSVLTLSKTDVFLVRFKNVYAYVCSLGNMDPSLLWTNCLRPEVSDDAI